MCTFNKIIALALLVIPFISNASEFFPKGHPKPTKEAQKTIEWLTEHFKKTNGAHNPDPIISDLAKKTLENCGIDEPVIILQRDKGPLSCVDSAPEDHPQKYLTVGTNGQTLDQIEAHIYHEAGHLANGDLSLERLYAENKYKQKAQAASLFTGLATGKIAYNFLPKTKIATLIGLAGMGATFISSACYAQHKHSLMEGKADSYAYQHQIKHGKLAQAVGRTSDLLYKTENNVEDLPSFLTGYPSNLERARIGITEMQKSGIVIADLVKNLPEDLDPSLKEHFPQQIAKYFPELV